MKKLFIKTYLFIYSILLSPWANAISISIWNKYLEHSMFKLRVQCIGEKLAKNMFFTDPAYLYQKYREEVFKDKKLVLKIIFLPFNIQPKKYLTEHQIITANDLWR